LIEPKMHQNNTVEWSKRYTLPPKNLQKFFARPLTVQQFGCIFNI
jgi:hypothetical protein